MAADPAPPDGGSVEKFGFLARKIGPLPVWAWGVIAVGVYYWYTHYGPGAKNASASAASGNGSGDNVTETLNTSTGPVTVSESSQTTDIPPGVPKPGTVTRTVKPPNHIPPHKTEPRIITVAKYPGKSANGRAQWDTTLWGIAQHEHVPLTALEKANPQVKNPDLVYPGEKIRIP